ncbi:ESX secretion-associated protein EspG [Nocardia transvalensis]|uniref:ESX secretion-associated protein EspG n=1 Tax=Nocardia transvalensis TaxID=37333 RepID=UPI0018960FD1|nr:ESX secretion-associated protein EspG [Nocardia transvalensis]MBF6330540.1 ESX secretion-associated protein EspG [Nocardia transvalensis]
MRWEFTQAEFAYAWDQLGSDRYPAPLVVRPEVSSQLAWETLKSELRVRFPVLQDPDLLPVLRTAADPDMSLIMIGARKRPLRAYGAVTSNIGVALVQRPGADDESGGNIVVQVGSPALVPKVFAAVAGDQPAGSHGPLVESLRRLEASTQSAGSVRDQPSAVERIYRLLDAPRVGQGHIEVEPDRHLDRRRPSGYFSWFDVEGDGRYTYTRRHGDFHIDPCSTEVFRTTIGRLMEIV